MQEVQTSIEINAPKERVWDVLTDFSQYDQWNPVIRDFAGALQQGSPVQFKIRLGKQSLPIKASLIGVDAPRDLRWRGPRSSVGALLVCGEHYFTIEELGEGRVRFVHGEKFKGWLIPLLWRRIKAQLEPRYAEVNEALKARAESSQ